MSEPLTPSEPAYGVLRQVTPIASVLLAQNPSPMTLEGTNTWLLRAPGFAAAVVVDPGPDDAGHRDRIVAAAGRVSLILLTHGHADHSEGARALHERTGAPVRALDPVLRLGAEGLADGDVVDGAGVTVRVLSTPGHTADSLSFHLEDGAVLTGDTILGRGTSVIAAPDGDLGAYLRSLRRLESLGPVPVLPGHGPERPDTEAVTRSYLAHREQRLQQVRAALAELRLPAEDASARAVVEAVYGDVDRSLWPAAQWSVLAQLAYLRAG